MFPADFTGADHPRNQRDRATALHAAPPCINHVDRPSDSCWYCSLVVDILKHIADGRVKKPRRVVLGLVDRFQGDERLIQKGAHR
jgi:hypothetical protein